MSPEQLAELFHETYERLAPAFGWKTKKGCHCKFAELPQRNKALMIATCQTVLNVLQECGAVDNGPQQLQAKIRARVERFAQLGTWRQDSDAINVFIADLRELSAV